MLLMPTEKYIQTRIIEIISMMKYKIKAKQIDYFNFVDHDTLYFFILSYSNRSNCVNQG